MGMTPFVGAKECDALDICIFQHSAFEGESCCSLNFFHHVFRELMRYFGKRTGVRAIRPVKTFGKGIRNFYSRELASSRLEFCVGDRNFVGHVVKEVRNTRALLCRGKM